MHHQLTFNNSTFCPHSVFMCFVWISEQTAIISLYNINWLVLITETECVDCAVRTKCIYIYNTGYQISLSISVPWLCLLSLGFSPPRPGFDLRSVYVRFVMDKLERETGSSLSTSFFPRTHHPTNSPFTYSSKSCSYREDTTGEA